MSRTYRTSLTTMAIFIALTLSVPAMATASQRGANWLAPREPSLRSHKHVAPELRAEPQDALTSALERDAISVADYSYFRALSLWNYPAVRRRFGDVSRPTGNDATMILRDLVLHEGELSRSRRVAAGSLLARPTDGGTDPLRDGYATAEATPLCSADVCVHWVTTTVDAISVSDVDSNGLPDYAEAVDAILEDIWANEVTNMGYRAPKSDATSSNHGPDGRLDVYLADVGGAGFYGYCTTDDPNASDLSNAYHDVSAYCVLDNDFAASQFPAPGANGLAALQVTAAHEFFHAVQFAYDVTEDPWFMEGTATWMEDELYDDVNDNRQYLSTSAIEKPWIPVDRGTGGYQYGTWIFWRFLSEYFDAAIVKQTWEYADASASGIDQYSLAAVAHAVRDRNRRFARTIADFGVWNAWPRAFYSEGASYPISLASASFDVTRRNGGVGWHHLALDHLTDPQVLFKPRRGVTTTATLRIYVDGPAAATSPEASVVVHFKSGATKEFPVRLNRRGYGHMALPFGRRRVAWADLVLTNASRRANCWMGTVYSCEGVPRDNDLTFRYRASLIQ